MIFDLRIGFLKLKAFSLKDEIESKKIDKILAYMKPLLINATNRAVINTDNHQFYLNKLLTLNNIKIQNDVLTTEKIAGYWTKHIGGKTEGLNALFMIYNCIKPIQQ